MRDNAKKTSCKSEADTIATGLEAYDVDQNTAGAATIASAKAAGYLKKVNAADWTTAYTSSEWVVTPSGSGKYNGVSGCP